MKKEKLQLTWIPYKNINCIPHPHYDLHRGEYNVACILTDKEGAKLIRKWMRKENNEL